MGILTTEAVQKIASYKDEFLAICPNNEVVDGTTTNKYTDLEWLNEVVKRYVIGILRSGEEILAEEERTKTDFDSELSDDNPS